MKEVHIYFSFLKNMWWLAVLVLVAAVCARLAAYAPQDRISMFPLAAIVIVIVVCFPGRALWERVTHRPTLTVAPDRLVHSTVWNRSEYRFADVRMVSDNSFWEYRMGRQHFLTIYLRDAKEPLQIRIDGLTREPEKIVFLVKDYFERYEQPESKE